MQKMGSLFGGQQLLTGQQTVTEVRLPRCSERLGSFEFFAALRNCNLERGVPEFQDGYRYYFDARLPSTQAVDDPVFATHFLDAGAGAAPEITQVIKQIDCLVASQDLS